MSEFKVSHEDRHILDEYRWRVSRRGYAFTCIEGKMVLMHRMIMGKPPEGLETDHINRDKLDNRRENLRFVTHRENLLNRSSKSASGAKGVYFCSGRSKPWRAQITRYGKRVNIGYYKSIEEAAAAVKERAEC